MGVANLLYVYGEVGVGGGIVADGHLLEGAHGYGGEIGHMRVNPDGGRCRCGSRGCWETEIGEAALVTLAGRRSSGRAAVEQVLEAARQGDRAALGAVGVVARWTGLGLANLVNCLNPELVILGGLLADLLEVVGPDIRSHMESGLVTPAHLAVQLVGPQLGRESVAPGRRPGRPGARPDRSLPSQHSVASQWSFSPTGSCPLVRQSFPPHVSRGLVDPHPTEAGMAQPPIVRPFGEVDRHHQVGSTQ